MGILDGAPIGTRNSDSGDISARVSYMKLKQ
jgi:hypothetical protein